MFDCWCFKPRLLFLVKYQKQGEHHIFTWKRKLILSICSFHCEWNVYFPATLAKQFCIINLFWQTQNMTSTLILSASFNRRQLQYIESLKQPWNLPTAAKLLLDWGLIVADLPNFPALTWREFYKWLYSVEYYYQIKGVLNSATFNLQSVTISSLRTHKTCLLILSATHTRLSDLCGDPQSLERK